MFNARLATLFFGAFLFACPLGASAQPAAKPAPMAAPSAPTVAAVAETDPSKFVQDLGAQAIAIIADKKLSPDDRTEKFRTMLRESFDMNTIGRFVLGRAWLGATPAQQSDYLQLFERLVVRTYTDRFALYTGEGFQVRSARAEGDHDFVVTSEITHPDGSPATTIEWRLRRKNDKLGIIDVVVEGVSMSITQRQDYAAVIQRNGGNIDALLNVMRQRLNDTTAVAKAKG